ncbi:MAG: HypC/HybG/HupF family hydrogenase formation chaperone [Gemmatimonadetes bacterium]|nr:HypC/HybG/HupF family hydrogenase formation chaperone [Gemmatimonadota bacterium]
MCLGIPGRIVEIRQDAGLPMGVVDFGGVRREVCLAYVADEVSVGDYAVVHVGFAISKVDEEEAQRTYDVLKEMGELDELQWVREAAEAAASVEAPANSGNGVGNSGVGTREAGSGTQ